MKKTGDVVKLGVAAAAAVGAVKVAEKFSEMKEATGGDINQDGVVDIQDTIDGLKMAAQEVYEGASKGVEDLKGKVTDPGFIAEAKAEVKETVAEMKETVAEATDVIKDKAADLKENM